MVYLVDGYSELFRSFPLTQKKDMATAKKQNRCSILLTDLFLGTIYTIRNCRRPMVKWMVDGFLGMPITPLAWLESIYLVSKRLRLLNFPIVQETIPHLSLLKIRNMWWPELGSVCRPITKTEMCLSTPTRRISKDTLASFQ